MSKLKEIAKTAKALVGIGNLKKPADWPVNPYKVELKKSGSFKESIVSTATGQTNKSMALLMNAQVVDMRDQQVLKYLRSKGIII